MTARIDPILDLDDLKTNYGTAAGHSPSTGIFASDEITIDADNKKFWFKGGGNLAAAGSGVTGQALYSFFKERWKSVPELPQYEFPMLSITNEQFEFINGWKPDDTVAVSQVGGFTTTTRKMIRTAGWAEVEVNNAVSRRYAGVISLGNLDAADQPYYVQGASFTAATVDTEYTSTVNEAVQIYGNIDYGDTAADDFVGSAAGTDTTSSFTATSKTITTTAPHGLAVGDVVKVTGSTSNNGYYIVATVPTTTSFTVKNTNDTAATIVDETVAATVTHVGFARNDYFKIFVRTRGKTYTDADLAAIGVSAMTYIVYRFPLTNATDLNIKTQGDNAFTGASIATIDGTTTTITVTTSAAHGLYVGAPITISGTTNYNGNFVVATVVGTLATSTEFTIASTAHDAASETAGTVILRYVSTMNVTYLPNPDTLTGDVVIKGAWAAGVQYALGDVVFDTANSKSNAEGARWYYVDATTGVSTGTNMNTDTANTWTLWSDGIGQRDIRENGTWAAFTAVYDLNSGGTTPGATKEIAYEYAQYILRSTADINASAQSTDRKGSIADPLVFFVGSLLTTYHDADIPFAVAVADIADTDVNNIEYRDYFGTAHRAPLVVPVTINFNNNLTGDADAVFYAYYTTGTGAQAGNDFGSTGALQLQKVSGGVASNVGSDVSNNVPNDGVYSFNYAYTADATNGRTTGENAAPVNVTIVSIGLNTGQYVSTSGDITNTGATFSLVAPLERNYTDPA